MTSSIDINKLNQVFIVSNISVFKSFKEIQQTIIALPRSVSLKFMIKYLPEKKKKKPKKKKKKKKKKKNATHSKYYIYVFSFAPPRQTYHPKT